MVLHGKRWGHLNLRKPGILCEANQMLTSNTSENGFTLVELLITLAIIGVLAAIAIPLYSDYISRARAVAGFAELGSVKTAVALCVQETGGAAGCNSGANDIVTPTLSQNVTVANPVADGVISITTAATDDNKVPLTIIDTPSLPVGASSMSWVNTGTTCLPANAKRAFGPGKGDCP